eukprot:snap_masked-scaffold_15-processed-gene-9.8-mRNA-1 protein AED:0.02 eAED:0.02 QI:0/0/0/1/1/1/2/0/1050
MVKKKVDERLRILLENSVKTNHRSLFFIIGDHAKDQVPNIHFMLSQTKAKTRPSVLWCYDKDLGFSTHKKKRLTQIKKLKQRGLYDSKTDNLFDLFISSTDIRYLYYRDSEKILGQTFGMLVLQDFEFLTPNLLAKTIETIEGGGLIVFVMNKLSNLKQFYRLTMNMHSKYSTELYKDVKPRFNERFILSLTKARNCVVLDDELNVLPISKYMKKIEAIDDDETKKKQSMKLLNLKKEVLETEIVGNLVSIAKTYDQAAALLRSMDLLLNSLGEKSVNQVCNISSGRGRGKSALLGLICAAAIGLGMRNVYITAPSPENLNTVFKFAVKGLESLKYKEHTDYTILRSKETGTNSILRINVFQGSKQMIQYIDPTDSQALIFADLLLIDEAAAIPLPVVKALLYRSNKLSKVKSESSSNVVFLSSTLSGYEGTGRSLSLKLLKSLREENKTKEENTDWRTNEFMFKKKVLEKMKNKGAKIESNEVIKQKRLVELDLDEPIRYSKGDPVEKWLNELLCLDVSDDLNSTDVQESILVHPDQCELFAIDRDTLFSFHKQTEKFLRQLLAIYSSAHYKNSPNDLLLLADNPSHRLFVLLKKDSMQKGLPEIICVLQVSFEGGIEKRIMSEQLRKGGGKAGDLVPWLVAQQFQLYNSSKTLSKGSFNKEVEFGSLRGCRVVRIATNPKYSRLGYGSKTIERLFGYISGKCYPILSEQKKTCFEYVPEEEESGEKIKPKKRLNPLMVPVTELEPIICHYASVSYGITEELFKFWSKLGYKPVYLRQTANLLTGEHSCVMLKELEAQELDKNWIYNFSEDFCRRFLSLQSAGFRSISIPLCLRVIEGSRKKLDQPVEEDKEKVKHFHDKLINNFDGFLIYDIRRLEAYSGNLIDYHLILDLVPRIAKSYFLLEFSSESGNPELIFNLSKVQETLLIGLGLKGLTIESIAKQLDLDVSQLLAFLNKIIRKFTKLMKTIIEEKASLEISTESNKQEKSKVEKSNKFEANIPDEVLDELKDKKVPKNLKVEHKDNGELKRKLAQAKKFSGRKNKHKRNRNK